MARTLQELEAAVEDRTVDTVHKESLDSMQEHLAEIEAALYRLKDED